MAGKEGAWRLLRMLAYLRLRVWFDKHSFYGLHDGPEERLLSLCECPI